jgi:hypothetical protein
MSEQHERFEALITKFVEGAASEAERAEVESHMASCSECRTALKTEIKAKEVMIHETKAFAEGYDAGRLEANLAYELRSGASATRWVAAVGALFGFLTIVLIVRPMASQPQAWSAALPLALACPGTLYWLRRKQARFVAIARAAEGARGGYRDLERARVEVNVRDFRIVGRFGLAVAFALPIVMGLFVLIERIRLQRAFPAAEVKVSLDGLPVSVTLIAFFLLCAPVSLYCLWKARRLETTIEERMKRPDQPH